MTYGSKPHAPEGQGWFPRGRGAARSPLGHPGDDCHPRDPALPPALARSQAGRRCRIAAKTTAWEPAPSTLMPRRGAMPRAGEGGRGEGEQGQPETPRADFSRHMLHSQRPAPAPMQRGSRICPSSPNNAGVHLSLLRALGAESRRCPCQGSPGQAPALPTGCDLLPGASSHRSIRFLRRLCCTAPRGGDGGISLPSGATPAPTSRKPPATPSPQLPHPRVLHMGMGKRKSQNPQVGETPVTARPSHFSCNAAGEEAPSLHLARVGGLNVPPQGTATGRGARKAPRKCWGLTQPRQSLAAATPCQGKPSHGTEVT